MVSKWFAWWNSLGLLKCVDYIRERGGCIETTSLVTSKTILINGVDVYETYTKEMVF